MAPNLRRKITLKYPKKRMLYQKLISYVMIAKILTFCLFLHIFLRCFAIDLVPDLSLCESYFFMKFSRSKYMRTNWKKYLYLENTENKFWCHNVAPTMLFLAKNSVANATPCYFGATLWHRRAPYIY